MSKATLLIRLHSLSQCEWQSDDGLDGEGSIEAVSVLSSNREVTLALPALWFNYFEIDVPAKSARKALQILPYALEDQLSEDPDWYYFSLRFFHKGRAGVWIVSKKLIHELNEMLRNHRIIVKHIVPESVLLPNTPEGLTIVLLKDYALVHHPSMPQMILPVVALNYYLQHEEALATFLSNILLVNEGRHQYQLAFPYTAFAQPLRHVMLIMAKKNTTSLQLPVALKAPVSSSAKVLWYGAASLLIGIILLQFLIMPRVQYYQLQKGIKENQQRMAEILRQVQPNVTRIVNPKVQLQNALSAPISHEVFGQLMLAMATAHRQYPFAIQQIHFQQQQLSYVVAATPTAVESLKKALLAANVQVKIESAPEEGQVIIILSEQGKS